MSIHTVLEGRVRVGTWEEPGRNLEPRMTCLPPWPVPLVEVVGSSTYLDNTHHRHSSVYDYATALHRRAFPCLTYSISPPRELMDLSSHPLIQWVLILIRMVRTGNGGHGGHGRHGGHGGNSTRSDRGYLATTISALRSFVTENHN